MMAAESFPGLNPAPTGLAEDYRPDRVSPPLPAPEPVSAPPCITPEEDSRWFKSEVQPHEPALRGYLRRKYPNLDTDDVVQESYLKLFRANSARKIISAKAFLFTVAVNTANTLFRRNKIYSPTPIDELPEWEVLEGNIPDVTETVQAHERRELLLSVVVELPSRCREIFLLRTVRGLSNGEIARQLGLNEGTVRTQVIRGMKRCAELLQERGVRPD